MDSFRREALQIRLKGFHSLVWGPFKVAGAQKARDLTHARCFRPGFGHFVFGTRWLS